MALYEVIISPKALSYVEAVYHQLQDNENTLPDALSA